MSKRHLLWPVFAATLALAACGGGIGSGDTTPPSNPPPPPPPIPAIDRIQPLDTSLIKTSAAAQAAPVAVSHMPAGVVVQRVALGPLVSTKAAAQPKGMVIIGRGRAVAATASAADLAAKLDWNKLADGSQVAALAFSADGAQAIRLGVLVQQLPANAVLRFYGAGGDPVVEMSAAQIQAMRSTNQAAGLTGDSANMIWGPDTAGSVSTLEVQIPASAAASQVQLTVPYLSHLTQTVTQSLQPQSTGATAKFGGLEDIGSSCSSNVDVMCQVPVPAESRAVAKLVFIVDPNTIITGDEPSVGDTAECSGTLMNDTLNSRTPYVLTASHCIPGQTEASSLITYWFFRAAFCNSSPVHDAALTRVTGGATLLQADPSVDAALVQLNAKPPAKVVYAGSYFGDGTVPTVGVFGIHHPVGDLQKFSQGSIVGYMTCGGGEDYAVCGASSTSLEGGTDYVVQFTQGVTQPGSSGSPLFVTLGTTHYVVGEVSIGSDDITTGSCSGQVGGSTRAGYGRFDTAFYHGLQNWLNPAVPTATQ